MGKVLSEKKATNSLCIAPGRLRATKSQSITAPGELVPSMAGLEAPAPAEVA